jgi:hypothetical protein
MPRYVHRPTTVGQRARAPEPFTEKHIQAIADEILADGRYPLLPTSFNRELAFAQAMDNIRRQSYGKLMSPDMFAFVKTTVVNNYYRCQAKIGMPVILIASEAFISAVMQATLNTFHKSGSANDTGFSAISEVLHVPPTRKKKQVYLHFTQPMTKKDVFLKRAELVYKNVESFIVDFEIEEFATLSKKWFHAPMMKAQNITVPDDRLVLRLHLNALDMIAHRVSIVDLIRPIADAKGDDVYFLFGSTKDGILDIVINPDVVTNKVVVNENVQDATFHRLYYNRYLYPSFSLFRVSGMEGVHGLYLGETTVVSAIRRMNKIDDEGVRELMQNAKIVQANQEVSEGGRTSMFAVILRRDTVQYEGISLADMDDLVRACGGRFVPSETDEYAAVMIMPGDVNASSSLLSNPRLPDTIGKDGKSHITPTDHLTSHYYAVLDSVMLETVLMLEECDINRTYCNNFHVMARVFGIEVARAYHFYNSTKIIETLDTTTSTRYIEAFSDVVSQRGRFLGINATGIAKQAGGFMSRATIAEPNKILPNAAIYDRYGESTISSATGITVGQPPRLGTGLSDYGVIAPVPPPILTEEDMQVVLLTIEGENQDATVVEGVTDDTFSSFDDFVNMQAYITLEQRGKARMGEVKRKVDTSALFSFRGDPSLVTVEVLSRLAIPKLKIGIPEGLLQQMDRYRPREMPKFFANPIITGIIPPIPPMTFKLREVPNINIDALWATLKWMRS